MIWVVAASTLPNYRLSVRFSDGAEGEVDLHDFIVTDSRPNVQSFGDPALFGALWVDLDTVVWPIKSQTQERGIGLLERRAR